MIPVEEAIARIVRAFEPLPPETVALDDALGRVLAEDARARLTQPPVAVSAMDGYAVRSAEVEKTPVRLRLVGAAPAGGAYEGTLGPGQAVRIFTGGSMPAGADTVVIQENVKVLSKDGIEVLEGAPRGRFVRPAGLDFKVGQTGIAAGRRLGARDIGLAAAMNIPWLKVRRKPRVAVLATGDEIVLPGEAVGPHQIVSSNSPGLCAAVRALGGEPINLGIAPDEPDELKGLLAAAGRADLLVTTGGVSVGERDLVRRALKELGFEPDFWKIAMRPGKPVTFGWLRGLPVLGLPGNPVSALVCALVLVEPALARMLGLTESERPRLEAARLGRDLPQNDERQEYLRAELVEDGAGLSVATPFEAQDSAMLATLARARCLIVRGPHAPAIRAGERVQILRFSPALLGL